VSAKDYYHETVKKALVKDGWTITDDPYKLQIEESKFYADLAAERIVAAERGVEKIAVEIKSFLGHSPMTDLERALGQYFIYRFILERQEPNRVLYLAVPLDAYLDVFDRNVGKLLMEKRVAKVFAFDPQREEIVRWLN
jgi:hypothetical protein